ncbi:hypothetical protein BS17DRAFT_783765 [Gyrodon lividus]|nr:hypothetical protein BS17DRAFT_783765 [Gyrodon lividus]
MFSKLSFVALLLTLWLGFNFPVSASPLPIVLPPSEGFVLFKDVIAREHIVAAARGDIPSTQSTESGKVVKREPIALPDPAPDEEVDVEVRICRFGCL